MGGDGRDVMGEGERRCKGGRYDRRAMSFTRYNSQGSLARTT